MKILSAAWHPGSANSIAPVIKQLENDPNVELEVLAFESAAEVFKDKGINCSEVSSPSLESMISIVDSINPDLTLTGTSNRNKKHNEVLEQNVTLATKVRGIASLAVVDVVSTYTEIFSGSKPNQRFLYLPDKVAVMNEKARQLMLEEGFPSEIIHVTGNPQFDDLSSIKSSFTQEDKERIRRELNISLNSYLVLFLSQPIEDDFGSDTSNPKYLGYTEKTVFSYLLETIQKTKQPEQGLVLLVKTHPREGEAESLKALASSYPSTRFIGRYNPRQLILAADLVISAFSTLLYDSTLLDKPSISLQPGLIKEDMIATNPLGITVPIYTKEEIVPTLERTIHNQSYQKDLKIKRDSFKIEGNATQNILNLIYR
ncbi:CDP-glycerol glycerophosphotransferase family protein [Candidatus Woesearchaeota archaeon]|nr:CDP-glycerol glycerophosphotransferase family protein [Candidatus Woesearchaeota archaeon]